ncbi:MAG: hypothetical protein BMS9Abin37_0549 [Acidobacteriota bacterium]|nr:MAG: hypothetical protein BMS9Abin37_0549 [Acidobacteriota bacterium]
MRSLESSRPTSSLLFDLRLIVRGFWRRPGFAIAATIPLALAMGANTTLFRVTNELVLQPRALLDSENLYVYDRPAFLEALG